TCVAHARSLTNAGRCGNQAAKERPLAAPRGQGVTAASPPACGFGRAKCSGGMGRAPLSTFFDSGIRVAASTSRETVPRPLRAAAPTPSVVGPGSPDRRSFSMKIHTATLGVVEAAPESFLPLPDGLIGFEEHKEFALLELSDYEPFRWL